MRKKEPSNHTALFPLGYTLPKSMILKGKRNFAALFSGSRTLSANTLILKYRSVPGDTCGIKVAFIAPGKLGNAVERNRIKRLLREAFRIQFRDFFTDVRKQDLCLHMAVIALNSGITYHSAHSDIKTVLASLSKRLHTTHTINPDNT